VLAADHGALADQAGWYNGGQNASVLDGEMMVLSRSKKAVMDGLSLSTDMPAVRQHRGDRIATTETVPVDRLVTLARYA